MLAGGKSTLSPGDFGDIDARRLFEGCNAILNRREPLSLTALNIELSRRHDAELQGRLMEMAVDAQMKHQLDVWQLKSFEGAVIEAARRRELSRIGTTLQRQAAELDADLEEITDSARTALRNSVRSAGGCIKMADTCAMVYEAAEHKERGIPTGISELDTILRGGLRRGELTILGARPAVGKSAMLLQMAISAARTGKHVMFASLEMSAEQIGTRVMAAHAGIDTYVLTSSESVPQESWTRMAEAITLISNNGVGNIKLFVRGGLTVEALRAEVQSRTDAGECDVLFVDYLQLLKTKQKTGGDFERLGIVSRGLKELTLDFGIPVVAAAQVKRQNNGGVLRAPGLDELRGSGDMEQDADNVLLLHRPESPDDSTLKTHGYTKRWNGMFERAQNAGMQLVTIDVAKQRQGRTARAWAVFNPSRMRFVDPGVMPA